MKKNVTELLKQYTRGEITLEETNAALAQTGFGLRLNPAKNVLTEEERRATTVGDHPEDANGWGLLDTGTGSMDKVQVKNGKLVHGGCGEIHALCLIADRVYKVEDDKLVEA